MKRLFIVSAAILVLSTGASYAGEGGGAPFEYTNPGVSSVSSLAQRLPPKGQDPFPFRVMDRVVTAMPFVLVPSERSEAIVQTENALPTAYVPLHMAVRDRSVAPHG
jgi:hypothetical protein